MIYRLLVQNYSTIIAVAVSNASLHLGFWDKKSYLKQGIMIQERLKDLRTERHLKLEELGG